MAATIPFTWRDGLRRFHPSSGEHAFGLSGADLIFAYHHRALSRSARELADSGIDEFTVCNARIAV